MSELLNQNRRHQQQHRNNDLDKLSLQTMVVMVVVMVFVTVVVMMLMVMKMLVTVVVTMTVAMTHFLTIACCLLTFAFQMIMFTIFHNTTFFPLIHRMVIAVIFGGKSGNFFPQPGCNYITTLFRCRDVPWRVSTYVLATA
jgi:hypothetical protein